MKIRFLGTADAFSSGGRNQSAILVECAGATFLLDCGPTTLTEMKRSGIAPDSLDFALISHAHGDHCAGIPFLFLEYEYMTERDRPFSILGPPGLEDRIERGTTAFYPTLAPERRRFVSHYHALSPQVPFEIEGIRILPYLARHVADFPCYGYRLEVEGKTLAFTGDTGWTEELVRLCSGVDLLITECTFLEASIDIHLSYEEIAQHRDRLAAKRILLTHLGMDVRKREEDIPLPLADDGLVIEL